MPTNLPKEYFLIENEYRKAKNLDERIKLLRKLISSVPKHKGTEHLLADLRKRLSRLEDDLERHARKSKSSKQDTIRKSGDILVSIIGFTQSGKSTFLNSLTNAAIEIGHKSYTTTEPETGVRFSEGVNIQFVEIPSFFEKRHMSIAHSSDVILLMARNGEEVENLEKILKENKMHSKNVIILVDYLNRKSEVEKDILQKIIKETNLVRIFMKPIGKSVEKKAVVVKNGSTVGNLIGRINEKWLDNFKFARIFDNSRFSGRQVGLDYVLKDRDILEIHVL